MGDLRLPNKAGCIGGIITYLILIFIGGMGYPLLAFILMVITIIIFVLTDS
jgi:hypothetical protein